MAYNADVFRQARQHYPQPSTLDPAQLPIEAVRELRRLVEAGACESEIDFFLRGEPNLLCGVAAAAQRAPQPGRVCSQHLLHAQLGRAAAAAAPDFLACTQGDRGSCLWAVTLKAPAARVFTGRGDALRVGNAASRGLVQATRALQFCRDHAGSLRAVLGAPDFACAIAVVVIGRDAELADAERSRSLEALQAHLRRVRVLSWDALLRALEAPACRGH